MSKIRIKNFGPIKEGFKEILPDGSTNEWIDIKKFAVFIGNQGSGKSTVAKLISTMSWLEKAFNRGDLEIKKFHTAYFLNCLKYQRINNYFDNEKTIIEYEGDAFYIGYNYDNKFPVVRKLDGKKYVVPQIMYVPAERNFLSSVSDAFNVKGLPATLFTFAEEFKKAQKNLRGKKIDLPINNYQYKYEEENDASLIIGKDYQINVLEASSGLQSVIPLFLVTRYLALSLSNKIERDRINVNNSVRMSEEIVMIMMKTTLTAEQKESEVFKVQNKYINKSFINIVEEPEQNLFPTSQHNMLNSLVEYNNLHQSNKLIMTTHSPYLINYLTLAVKAEMVKSKLGTEEGKKKLAKIIPLQSTVKGGDLMIFEMDEKNGTIKKLQDYKGLPSDENELNSELEETNELFAQLQEIEKGWR